MKAFNIKDFDIFGGKASPRKKNAYFFYIAQIFIMLNKLFI